MTTYRALLEGLVAEAKSEKARAVILARYGERMKNSFTWSNDAKAKEFREKGPEAFLSWLEEIDPTTNSIYVDWMIRRYFSRDFRFVEDLGKMTDMLVRYEELKPKLSVELRDINKFDYSSFSNLLDTLSTTDARSNAEIERQKEQKLLSSGSAVIHYDSPEIKIVIPKTAEAAQWFGRNTRWCTSAKSNNMFDEYNQDGPLYIVLFKKTNTRWQFHFESDQYMDEKDEELGRKQIKSVIHLFDLPLEKNGHLIRFIDSPSEEEQLAAAQQDGIVIDYIKNPSEAVQLAAVQQTGFAIDYIKNPSEAVQLAAVQNNGYTLSDIENPSEAVKLAAVQENGHAIRYIENPSEEIQIAAVRQDASVIHRLRNPSEAVISATLESDGFRIRDMVNPSEEEQLIAVSQVGRAIHWIKNPSERVQIAAVKQDPKCIQYIKNPTERVKRLAATKR